MLGINRYYCILSSSAFGNLFGDRPLTLLDTRRQVRLHRLYCVWRWSLFSFQATLSGIGRDLLTVNLFAARHDGMALSELVMPLTGKTMVRE